MAEMWVDHLGRSWRIPQIKGRLKMRIPSHRALREYVTARDGKCVRCGNSDALKLVADHIISRRNGGEHHPANMQCLCSSCNSRKAGKEDSKAARG